MLAADAQSGSAGSGEPHCPSEPASAWGQWLTRAAARWCSQELSPCSAVSAPQGLPTAICGGCGAFHVRSAAHKAPTQGLTSAVFTVQRAWLLHPESWVASWRNHTPLPGNHVGFSPCGISPVRCLWQLQGHRTVTAGETRTECEGGSSSPATVCSPHGTGKHRVFTYNQGATWLQVGLTFHT